MTPISNLTKENNPIPPTFLKYNTYSPLADEIERIVFPFDKMRGLGQR